MKPLKGGLKLEGKKDATLIPWSSGRPGPPKRVRIPLDQETNSPARPLVGKGDRVRLGEKIAQTEQGIALHASVSGEVTEVNSVIEILSDGKDEPVREFVRPRTNWESLSTDELREILLDSGIQPPQGLVHTLILNACESEPYLTCDHSLLMSHPVEILKGAEILKRLLGAQEVILVLEDNKEEVAEVLKSKIFFHTWSKTRVEVVPARYPQEDETVLMAAFSRGASAQ